MNVDLGVRHALLDVVDLRFDGGHVVLRAALENELAAERSHAGHADDVLPNVLRKHLREPREELFFAEALLLEVHAIGVEEDRAAVAELRSELGLERIVRVLGDGQPELIGHGLQQHAVAGRTLIRELERLDVAVLHEEDFDVLPADVADDVDVAEVVRRAHHVRDGFDDVDVGLRTHSSSTSAAYPVAPKPSTSISAPLAAIRPRSSASSSFASWMGLPFERVYAFIKTSPSSLKQNRLRRGAATVEPDHGAHAFRRRPRAR